MSDESETSPGQDPAFDPLAESKRILRATRAGTLATVNAAGDPFASLVTVATDPDGSPLILVSQLSAHTRHMDKDARVSLLLAETGQGDPLAHPRLTLTGRAEKVVEPTARKAVRARFLSPRHPKAELYADFADFSFWRIGLEQVHLNGGFARAARFPGPRLLTSARRRRDAARRRGGRRGAHERRPQRCAGAVCGKDRRQACGRVARHRPSTPTAWTSPAAISPRACRSRRR